MDDLYVNDTLIDGRTADDSTTIGLGEFHEPVCRRAGEDQIRDAAIGQQVTVGGRRWEVIEDAKAHAGSRWAEIG